MIRNLQIKFIALMMGVLMLVFAVVLITLNLFMRASSTGQTELLLETVAGQDGGVLYPKGEPPRPGGAPGEMSPPPPPDNHRMRSSRFFFVKVDSEGEALDARYDLIYGLSESDALGYAQTVLARNQDKGTVDNFQYLVAEKDYGRILVFAERSIETQLLGQLISVSLWVAGATFLALLAFSILLSRWAVGPVKNAFAKQRRFVSDASHELKTPLTIIAANADVLENEIGENIRVSSIKEQAGRMNLLIHDLLSLAKTDEGQPLTVMEEFDLSGAVLGAVLEFESRAFEERKSLDYQVQEGISYRGSESAIRQMIAIFVDNAIKHSAPKGEINVRLKQEGGKLAFSVYNTGMGVAEKEQDKIFERFYRSDDSRSRETGGYGLGLAIAKSIVDQHKGKITVTGKPGEWVRFTVLL